MFHPIRTLMTLLAAAAILLLAPPPAEALPAGKVYRIGFLTPGRSGRLQGPAGRVPGGPAGARLRRGQEPLYRRALCRGTAREASGARRRAGSARARRHRHPRRAALARGFGKLRRERPDALMHFGYAMIATYRREIAAFAPAFARMKAERVDGIVVLRMGLFVHLRGDMTARARAAGLPSLFGVTFPRSILLRADRVIE